MEKETMSANMQTSTKDEPDGLDLIWGVDAIAAELNLTRCQTYHQLETGRLPARKHAGKWCASRRGLLKFFESLVAGEVV
jgi:hypothetical protein